MNEVILILVGLALILATALWYIEIKNAKWYMSRISKYEKEAEEWKSIANYWKGCAAGRELYITLKNGDTHFGYLEMCDGTQTTLAIRNMRCTFPTKDIQKIEYAGR